MSDIEGETVYFNKNVQNFGTSIRGFEWKLPDVPYAEVENMMQKLNISMSLAMVLINRGICTPEAAKAFLDPKIKDVMQDPFQLLDCEKAAKRIAQAIESNEKIAIFGDYDVDGATSSALMYRFMKSLGAEVLVYIPNRMTEGYGPTPYAFKRLKEMGASLIITVDCGTVAFEAMEEAHVLGVEVVVIDHHIGSHTLPKAYAVVNPNRFDEKYSDKFMAAVGVSFFVVVAIRAILRTTNWFSKSGVKEPMLMDLLDLIALGTVCDVVPLIGMNRAFVTQGLKLISTRSNTGIAVLSDIARINTKPLSYHLGFVFGPRINAGGRVGEGMLGTRLLSTDDYPEAFTIAKRLERLNNERKVIEMLSLEEAVSIIESTNAKNDSVIVVVGYEWHIGILGILAGRLKELYSKPVVVISVADGIGKGSARSIPGVDLGTLITKANAQGLIINGGGHAMAGGFMVEESKIPVLREFISKSFENVDEYIEMASEVLIDIVTTIDGVDEEIMDVLDSAGPFGSGNPNPNIVLTNVRILHAKFIKPNHISIMLCDANNASKTIKSIFFKGYGTKVGDFLLSGKDKIINVLGSMNYKNTKYDKKLDFILKDVATTNT